MGRVLDQHLGLSSRESSRDWGGSRDFFRSPGVFVGFTFFVLFLSFVFRIFRVFFLLTAADAGKARFSGAIESPVGARSSRTAVTSEFIITAGISTSRSSRIVETMDTVSEAI